MHLNRQCGDMIPTQTFNIDDIDGLDRWSRERSGLMPNANRHLITLASVQ